MVFVLRYIKFKKTRGMEYGNKKTKIFGYASHTET